MKLAEIKRKVKEGRYVYTLHAEIERKADDLTFHQIEQALLTSEVLEQYPDAGRGKFVDPWTRRKGHEKEKV